MLAARIAAQGQDRGVFQQQEHVIDRAGATQIHQPTLQVERCTIWNPA
jgi:hypothetical protein